jgi:hypothetical protein
LSRCLVVVERKCATYITSLIVTSTCITDDNRKDGKLTPYNVHHSKQTCSLREILTFSFTYKKLVILQTKGVSLRSDHFEGLGCLGVFPYKNGRLYRGSELKFKSKQLLWNQFYSWGTNFRGFLDRLIHEIKNPTKNDTWEAVWHRYIAYMLSSSDFLNQLHRVQLTILIME